MELVLDNISIEGVSRSTIETYFHIKELKLSFDIGKCPFHLTTVPNVFLSHMHGDHAIGIYYYISHRNLAKMEAGKIYLPEEAVKETENVIKSYASLEMANRYYELIGLTKNQEFDYGRDYVVKTFETDHRVPSLGYIFYTKKNKLKNEFINLPQKEIITLKNKGVEITNTIYEPFITYLGDSTIKPLDEFDFIKKSKYLIMECTFLTDEHYDQAEERKHIHIKNIIDRADEFENKYIILTHFSMRYTESFIRDYIKKVLPESLREKVVVFF
ncbi:MAG: MBL fold metallo-hydrolase [Candidatus Sericytochromatia bacterium]